jgi:hypothetical protein
MRPLLLIVLLSSLAFAAGPAAAPSPKAAPILSDSVIEQNIRARFAKSKISAEKFSVRVQGGVAVVEGTTNVVQRKGVATRLAKAGGARAVDNRIRIGEQARKEAAEKLAEHRKPTRSATSPVRSAPAGLPAVATPPATKPIPRAQVKN